MRITYKSKKIEKVCTVASEAEKKYGLEMAAKIHQRIDEISSADTIEEMVQYAVDLVQPNRLVFQKEGDEIQIAKIMEIVDYH